MCSNTPSSLRRLDIAVASVNGALVTRTCKGSGPAPVQAPTHWWELSVAVPVRAAEAVSARLWALGALGVQELHPELVGEGHALPLLAGDEDHIEVPRASSGIVTLAGTWPGERDPEELEAELTRELATLADAWPTLAEVVPGRTRHEPQDWNATWSEDYRGVRLSRRIRVAPPWEELEELPGEVLVRVDPGMAFGTGTHFTTAVCARLLDGWLDRWRGPLPPSALDVGCGTGVLALAARALGATPVMGVDVDPDAIAASPRQRRTERNRTGPLGGGQRGRHPPARHDLVIANVLYRVIDALAEQLVARLAPGGGLILSGLLVSQEAPTLARFRALGLHLTQREDDGEWVGLLLTAPADPAGG